MKQLHSIQTKILDGLLFSKSSEYSDLKPLNMENSKFVFHLKQLTKAGYVEKNKDKYSLTDVGKEYANRYTTETFSLDPIVKVTTVIIATRTRNSHREFLVYKRLKNPFYGFMGFPTEKPKWGETLKQAAGRGLKEEAGMEGKGQLLAIRHYIVKSAGEKVLEDKLMHAYLFSEPKGNLEGNNEGEYFWVPENGLKEFVQPPLEEFWEFYNYLNGKNNEFFKEKTFTAHKF